MKLFPLLFFSLIFFQDVAAAQTANSPCPPFSLKASRNPSSPNENISYKVVFNEDFDASRLVYVWSVSNGEIIKGQGSPAITFNWENIHKSITVGVKIQGLPKNCASTISEDLYLELLSSPKQASVCPAIWVSVSPQMINPDKMVSFKLEIKDFDLSKLKVKWAVSGAEVIKDQETFFIDVKPICQKSMASFTAKAEISGLPEACPNTARETVSISHCGRSRAEKFDEYGKISIKNEKSRLDKLVAELKKEPTDSVLIIKSFPGNVSRTDAYKDMQRILNYLELSGISNWRIRLGASFNKQEQTTIYLVPAGAELGLNLFAFDHFAETFFRQLANDLFDE